VSLRDGIPSKEAKEVGVLCLSLIHAGYAAQLPLAWDPTGGPCCCSRSPKAKGSPLAWAWWPVEPRMPLGRSHAFLALPLPARGMCGYCSKVIRALGLAICVATVSRLCKSARMCGINTLHPTAPQSPASCFLE